MNPNGNYNLNFGGVNGTVDMGDESPLRLGQRSLADMETGLFNRTDNSGLFFDKYASHLDNFNQGLGAVGSIVSLADALNNFGMQKKLLKSNKQALDQQRKQSKVAFDRNVARQDRSLAAVRQANGMTPAPQSLAMG